MKKKIKEVIDDLRSYIVDDGGDMEFVSFDKKTKKLIIKVKGACVGCQFFSDTFDDNIKQVILIKLPFVKDVEFI